MIEIKETDVNGVLLRTNTFAYDSKKRLAATTYGAVGQTYRPIYEKNASGHEYPDDVVVGIKLDGKFTDQTTKDGLGRVTTRTLTVENSPLLTENYSYLKTSLASGKTIETAIVSGTTGQIGSTSANTSYTYDISGNIETVTVDSVLVAKYHYDKWNRIVREDNHKFGKTYTWEYDIGGNIIEKRTYALCTGDAVSGEYTSDNYEYATNGWKDQLTSFNGEVCEYDALGNPTIYRGKELTWTKVRCLAKFGDVEFTYNANGTRTSKTADGITHTYTLVGGSVVKETDGTNTLIYCIGGNGFVGFNCNGIDYYYRKNPQGDVIGIYTSSGVKVASYVYDAWGNHKIFDANGNEVNSTTHIGYINPIRYRGYYFDVETNLYYLKTRYYDPQTGRFITRDNINYIVPHILTGLNLYAYCINNPIAFKDPSGTCVHNGKKDKECNICRDRRRNAELAGLPYEETPEEYYDYYEGGNTGIDDELAMAIGTNSTGFMSAFMEILASNSDDLVKVVNQSSTITDVVFVGLDVVIGIRENVDNDASFEKIYHDARVDIAFSGASAAISSVAGTKVGSAVGTAICPVVGTVVGAFVGFGVGMLSYYVTDVWTYGTDKTLREHVKGWVE